jgi:hypothetical protein
MVVLEKGLTFVIDTVGDIDRTSSRYDGLRRAAVLYA